MKNCKTFYEAQKTRRINEVTQPPPNPSETEINRHLLSKCFKNAVLAVKERWSANVFSDTKQKHGCWKIFSKFGKVFGCVAKAYYLKCQTS